MTCATCPDGGSARGGERAAPRSWATLLALGLAALLLFSAFVALGSWQVERRAWKLDLIARVERRLQAAPVAAPARDTWATLDIAADEYLKVRVDGVFDHAHETLVQAVTAQGPGFWLLTPLRLADGSAVFVNRGFVDAGHREPASRAAAQTDGAVHVVGLLRRSEPRGAFLRRNDPAQGRWFSRDVAAIAAADGLDAAGVAPYFIDADATPNPGGWPLGGLTVVQFHNSHLVYLLTWYTLAAMVAGAGFCVGRHEWRLRRATAG
ncbi:MAG: SURF1 family protein [Solimonas sp.]